MFRRLMAAALVLLVQLGAISAPLLHVHLEDRETPHHHGQALHAHLSDHAATHAHPGSGPVVDHDEAGRTMTPQIFVSGAIDPFDAPALASPCFRLLIPAATAVGRTPHVAHGHDPPCRLSLSPRAPPAFLS